MEVNMFSWLNFLSYAIVTAVTPGPNNIMSMSNAGRLGFRKSFPFNLGIWAGFSIVMIVCTFFCNMISEIIPKIKTPMLVIGALYMLWLAWKTLKSSSVIEENHSQISFISGAFLQFVNPKIYIYCIVSMEAYILPHYQGQWVALIFFALLLAFIGFAFTLCWSLFGSVFKLLFSKYAKITNLIMAGLLVYCAISLFL
jgi:threonine/homoserine/homoserine lactone efflux protein